MKKTEIIQALFFMFVLLALTACTQAAYPAENEGAPSILLLSRGSDISRPSLSVSCLQSNDCNYQIDGLTIDEIDLFNCILDESSNIYCLLSNSDGNDQSTQKGDLIFIDFKTKQLKQISLSDPISGLETVSFLHPVQSLEEQITFMDSEGHLFVLRNGALVREIQLPLSEEARNSREIQPDEKTNFNLIVPGTALIQEGKAIGWVYLVDTLTGSVEPRWIPLPDFVEAPYPSTPVAGTRYGMKIGSLNDDLQTVFITYDEAQSDDQNSLTSVTSRYDWQTGVEVKIKDIGSFENYRGVFYRPVLFRTEIASISPLPILGVFARDWKQVEEFQTIGAEALAKGSDKIQIRPFGDTFLIGTDDSVYQVATDTDSVQKFQLPDALRESDYFIVQYQN